MSRLSEPRTSPFVLLIAVVLIGGLGYVAWHDLYDGGGKPAAPQPAPPPAPPPPTLPEPPLNAIAHLPVQAVRAAAASREECVRLAEDRASFDPEALKVFGTVVSGENSTAILASGKSHAETVQVGDYVGSHCWRVTAIGDDSVTLMSPGPSPRTVEVAISAEPRTPARKERRHR